MSLTERLRQCVKLAQSGDELSRRSGIPRRTLENYLSERSEPKASNLEQICKITGVSGHWLLTGDGPMLLKDLGAGAQAPAAPLDEETLEYVIEALEERIAAAGKKPPASKKAKAIAALYDYVMDGHKGDPKMERFLQLVA